MKRYQGIILFSCMMILSLLALLVLSEMQLLQLHWKALQRFILYETQLQELEAEVALLAKKTDWPEPCTMSPQGVKALIGHLKAGEGCRNHIKFRYMVEALGVVPCVQIMVHNQLYSTMHWRLTVLMEAKSPITLQVRLARPTQDNQCIRQDYVIINGSRLNWNVYQ